MVRLCRVLLDTHSHPLVDSAAPRKLYDDNLSLSWRQLWDATALALAAFKATSDDNYAYEPDALECLTLLNTWYQLDGRSDVAKSPSGVPDRDESTEPFPDTLFAVLSLFVSKQDTLGKFRNIYTQLARSDMVSAVPGLRLQDEFSGETLWEYLSKAGFELHRLFYPCLFGVLCARIPSLPIALTVGADVYPDCTTLTRRAWVLTSNIAASCITRYLPDDLDSGDAVNITNGIKDALLLLLARSEYDIPSQGVRALSACLRPRTLGMTAHIIAACSWSRDPKKLEHVLRRMRRSMALLPDHRVASLAVHTIAKCAFYKLSEGEQCQHRSVQHCWAHRDFNCDEFWLAIRNVYMDRVGDLVKLVDSNSDTSDNWIAFDWANCCRIPRSAMDEFHNMLRQLLLHPTNQYSASRIYDPVVVLDEKCRRPSFPTIAQGIHTVYYAADETSTCTHWTHTLLILTAILSQRATNFSVFLHHSRAVTTRVLSR